MVNHREGYVNFLGIEFQLRKISCITEFNNEKIKLLKFKYTNKAQTLAKPHAYLSHYFFVFIIVEWAFFRTQKN